MGGACPTHAIASIYTGNYTTSADANIWNDADPENLSDYEREVIEEMKARDISP